MPATLWNTGTVAGHFAGTPKGVILHGSRSGNAANSIHKEYMGTALFAGSGANGLGWNATVGEDEIAIHMTYRQWGWNARGVSSTYYGVELAQATVINKITDAQVRAFCWFFQQCRAQYPQLPKFFPTHAELDGTAEYGLYDGKTDVFPENDPRADELRGRIVARLAELGI